MATHVNLYNTVQQVSFVRPTSFQTFIADLSVINISRLCIYAENTTIYSLLNDKVKLAADLTNEILSVLNSSRNGLLILTHPTRYYSL